MDSNPYTAPSTTQPASTPGMQGPYGAFRNNGPLRTTIVSLLIIDAMMSIFSSGILNLLDIKQQNSDSYLLTDDPTQLDNIVSIVGGVHFFIIIILAIVFGAWINRSCKNAWLLDAPRMKTTPGWAVGYYFIPIANLWKPYGSMKEIRSASYGNDNALRSILPLWWTFWLISSFLGNIISRLFLASDDTESYLMACKLDLVSVPIDVILNYLAIALVTGITLAQQRRENYWKS